MRKDFTSAAAMALVCLASTASLGAPSTATIISKQDVDTVLKSKLGDHTIRVMDMGQGYNMSVAVVSRGRHRDTYRQPHRPTPGPAVIATNTRKHEDSHRNFRAFVPSWLIANATDLSTPVHSQRHVLTAHRHR